MTFESIISNKPKHVIEIALRVRAILMKCHPKIQEALYSAKVMQGGGYYIGKSTNHVAIISPEDLHCKIYITHFDQLKLHGLKLEGKGSKSRHLKIFQVDDIPQTELKDIFKNVARLAAKA